MKDIKIFTKGERVLIEAVVADIELRGDGVRYELKDPRTEKCYEYLYSESEITAIQE